MKQNVLIEVDIRKNNYPYFALSDKVIYITRGLNAEMSNSGIAFSEWKNVHETISEIELDERYEITNPHTDEIIRYREIGRSRCLSSDSQPGWFSYMPHHISSIVDKKLPSVRLATRFSKIVTELGDSELNLGQWCKYVAKNRYLNLEEDYQVNSKTVKTPGRTVTTAKSGGVIKYFPSAVFIYFSPAAYDSEEPDPKFLKVAKKIAKLLRAEVVTKNFPK